MFSNTNTEMYSAVMEGTGKMTREDNFIDSNMQGQEITGDLLLKKISFPRYVTCFSM